MAALSQVTNLVGRVYNIIHGTKHFERWFSTAATVIIIIQMMKLPDLQLMHISIDNYRIYFYTHPLRFHTLSPWISFCQGSLRQNLFPKNIYWYLFGNGNYLLLMKTRLYKNKF